MHHRLQKVFRDTDVLERDPGCRCWKENFHLPLLCVYHPDDPKFYNWMELHATHNNGILASPGRLKPLDYLNCP